MNPSFCIIFKVYLGVNDSGFFLVTYVHANSSLFITLSTPPSTI